MSIQDLSGQALGQYKLRELLGVGGMGAVYRARQASLQRDVAVKVISPELVSQADYIERFYREAKIAAGLEHAHIVPVYDYGVQRDISYVVMRLLTGGTLMERLKQQAETEMALPSLAEITELLKQLASALDYAHSQGVIHRDIKPNNVMFDNQGNAYLVDFGIAKLLGATRALTSSGILMGTPLFMAPEQWRAEDITPATDQYALGAMTYVLVTGRVPFEADTPHSLMYKHLNEMPSPPHVYRPEVPESLTAVLEHAMAKRPSDRFPTVTAFAQAFERALGEGHDERTNFFSAPVRRTKPAASTPSMMTATSRDHLKSLGSKRWALAALGLAVVLIVLALLLPGKNNPKEKPTVSNDAVGTAAAGTLSALGITAVPGSGTTRPTETFGPTRTLPETPVPASHTAEPTEMFTKTLPAATATIVLPQTQVWIDLSATASQWTPTFTFTPTATPNYTATYSAYMAVVGQTLTAESWTNTPTLTYTPSLTPTLTDTPTPTPTFTLTVTPSLTPTFTLTPTLTNTPTQTPTPIPPPLLTLDNVTQITQLARFQRDWTWIDAIAWSPDGNTIAVSGNAQGTWMYDAHDLNAEPRFVQHEYIVGVRTMAWSPDSSLLAFGDSYDTAFVLDVHSGSFRFTLQGHTEWVDCVAFSPDGLLLASASDDGTIRLWDMTTGQEVRLLEGHKGGVSGVAWSPDGSRLVSVGGDNKVMIWDVAAGTMERALETQFYNSPDKVAWSPDGSRIAAGGYEGIQLWDAVSGQSLYVLSTGNSWVGALAFSPGGTFLASGQQDATLRIWDAANGRELVTLDRHTGGVKGVTWSPDGSRLASASDDGTVRVWGIPTETATGATPLPPLPSGITPAATVSSPAAEANVITPENATQVTQLKRIEHNQTWSGAIAWSVDGATLAVPTTTGVWMYDVRHLDADPNLLEDTSLDLSALNAAWLPDGTLLIFGNWDNAIQVWDVIYHRQLHNLTGHTESIEDIALSPDGSLLASASSDRTVRVWDMATGQELRLLEGHTSMVECVAWSPDGTRLASGGHDETIRVWEVATGNTLYILENLPASAGKVAWSPDGKLLASADFYGVNIQLWDAGTGQLLYTLGGSANVTSLAFSPDSSLLVSGQDDGTLELWDTAAGRQLSTLPGHITRVYKIVWSPDGTLFASGGQDNTVRVWGVTLSN